MNQSDPSQGSRLEVPLHHGGRAARQAAAGRRQAARRDAQPQAHADRGGGGLAGTVSWEILDEVPSSRARGGRPRSSRHGASSSSASRAASAPTRPARCCASCSGATLDVRVVMTRAATRFVDAADVRGALAPPGVPRPVRARRRTARSATSAWPTRPSCCSSPRPPPTSSASSRTASRTTRSARSYLATNAPAGGRAGDERQHVRAPGRPGEPGARCGRAGVRVVEPGSGYLACGWLGKGRLAETGEIVDAALAVLQPPARPRGRDRARDAGPTVEDIDPVRFISNRSSGRMGYRIAEAARDRGAAVVLVSGPTSLPAPGGVEVVACARPRRCSAPCSSGCRGRRSWSAPRPSATIGPRRSPARSSRRRPGRSARAGPDARHPDGRRGREGRARPGRLRGRDGGPARERAREAASRRTST